MELYKDVSYSLVYAQASCLVKHHWYWFPVVGPVQELAS